MCAISEAFKARKRDREAQGMDMDKRAFVEVN